MAVIKPKNTQDQIKKEKERLVVEQFRDTYTKFPKGKLVLSESPDFVIRTGPRYSIGIELVSLPYSGTSRSQEDIKHVLELKQEKLPLYRKKRLDIYWLLIYTDSPGQISSPELNKIQDTRYQSEFHKVYLLLIPENKIIILK